MMPTQDKHAGTIPTLSEKLRAVPLVVALVPMAAGIALGTLSEVPFHVWAIACAVCAPTAWLVARKRGVSALCSLLAILFFGAALARLHTPHSVVPQGERVWMEVHIADNPSRRNDRKSASTTGTAVRWQPESDRTDRTGNGAHLSTGEWRHAGEKLLVSFDTMYDFRAGDRVVFRSYVNPVDDTATSYSRLMRARGYTGRTYISQYSRPSVSPARAAGATIKRLQLVATERLHRLNIAPDQAAVAAAMTTGRRDDITPELREAYSRTGASHLLAVSGLHVGIVFVLVNIMLYLLPLARGGHIAKNIVAVVAIWFYAALTGLSPSATRAAFMFSGAQLALASSQSRNSANIMCGTALVMLAIKPGLLFDISFQLSFIAVAAILAWFRPLYGLVESSWRGLNALWATLIVGFAASVATMPLVSHTFGVFSPVGIVLNPIVIATAHLVVVFSLVWIAVPLPFLEPVFGWLVGTPAWLQNRVIGAVAEVPGVAIEWTMPLWLVFAIYTLMIIFTLLQAAICRTSRPVRKLE